MITKLLTSSFSTDLEMDKGHRMSIVKAGNYELFRTRSSKDIIDESARMLPGTEITMAILILAPVLYDEKCPMPQCQSIETTPRPGGGWIW